VADANLRCAHEGFAAVAQLAVDGEVVVELTALDEGFQLSAEFGNFEAGDIAELHEGVGADVAAAAGAAGALGSTRQTAWVWPVASSLVASQPWM